MNATTYKSGLEITIGDTIVNSAGTFGHAGGTVEAIKHGTAASGAEYVDLLLRGGGRVRAWRGGRYQIDTSAAV